MERPSGPPGRFDSSLPFRPPERQTLRSASWRIMSANGLASRSLWKIDPGGMDSRLLNRIHDVFKLAMEQRNHVDALARFDQRLEYMSPAEYARFAAATMASERLVIEKLGLHLPG